MSLFFDKKKSVRHFADILFLFAISEMNGATAKQIDDWIFNHFGFRSTSSYLYPALNKLTGGFVPFVIANPVTRKYEINPAANLKKVLDPQLKELLSFIEQLKDIISYE